MIASGAAVSLASRKLVREGQVLLAAIASVSACLYLPGVRKFFKEAS